MATKGNLSSFEICLNPLSFCLVVTWLMDPMMASLVIDKIQNLTVQSVKRIEKLILSISLQQMEPILWKYGKSAEFELFRGSKEVPFSRNFECE